MKGNPVTISTADSNKPTLDKFDIMSKALAKGNDFRISRTFGGTRGKHDEYIYALKKVSETEDMQIVEEK